MRRIHKAIVNGATLALMVFTTSGLAYADTITVGGTGAAIGSIRLLAQAFEQRYPEHAVIVPPSLGSGGSIKAVNAAGIEIGLSSRPLKEKEKTAGATAIPYARSPFVVVVSGAVQAPGFRLDELVEIFAGSRASWPDGSPIRLVLRPVRDGDSALLASMHPELKDALARMHKTPGIAIGRTDQDAMQLAEAKPGWITTATLSAIISEQRNLTPAAIDGIEPTLDNLADGRYRFAKTLYLIVSSDPKPLAQQFIDFIFSAEGAKILTATGNLVVPKNG